MTNVDEPLDKARDALSQPAHGNRVPTRVLELDLLLEYRISRPLYMLKVEHTMIENDTTETLTHKQKWVVDRPKRVAALALTKLG